jgi:hypothetical protein
MALTIHECLIRIEKRAERAGEDKLTETFVDVAPLLASVSTSDHQVIFGRRGTGKTHILKHLHDTARTNGNISLYLDLRSIGSNGSIYNDRAKTHAQRATPLLLDVLQAVQDALLEVAVTFAEEHDLSKVGPRDRPEPGGRRAPLPRPTSGCRSRHPGCPRSRRSAGFVLPPASGRSLAL